MFTDEVVLSLDDAFNIDFNRMVDKYTITKNPTDGSLRIELIMKRLTDEGAEQPGTDDLCKLTVDPYDLNLQATAEGEEARVYYGKRGEKVTLTAPKLEGESFYSWESTDTDLIPDEDGGNLYLINGNMTKLADAGLFGKNGGTNDGNENGGNRPDSAIRQESEGQQRVNPAGR